MHKSEDVIDPRAAEAGSRPDALASILARAEIEATEYRFSEGTDALGRGDIAGAKQIYRECFTEDGLFEAYLPGSDRSGRPDVSAVGPDGLSELVGGLFAAAGYTATQHNVTNIRIALRGSAASVVSYAEAVQVLRWNQSIDVAHGTYFDEVVHTAQGWKIAHRKLHLITSLRLESPGA
jgi:SnoaL-like protein